MGLDIHVTVAALVVRDHRFLCVEEMVGGRLVINQPAGHLEAHESLLQAVVRETCEETAWDFVPRALLGVYHYTSAHDVTYMRFTFLGDVTTHHPKQALDKGIQRALWLTRAELLSCVDRHRGPQVMRTVLDYERGRRYPLDALVSPL